MTLVPSGSVTVTVEPGSAVPDTELSLLVTSLIVGVLGAVVSLTVCLVSPDTLPSLSVAVIVTSSPPCKSFGKSIS